MQLEIQLWSSEKRSGLDTRVKQIILSGERKEQSSKKLRCLGVGNRERSSDQRAEDTGLQSHRLVELKERRRGHQCQTDKKSEMRPRRTVQRQE